jgi:hypothetical protein
MEGQRVAANIANVFACKFSEACSPWDAAAAADALTSVEARLAALPPDFDDICADEVRAAIMSKMKFGKTADCLGLRGEHFLLGGGIADEFLASVLNELIRSHHVPPALRTSVFLPLLKGHRLEPSDPDNYRGIAISPMFYRVLEAVLLLRWEQLLETSSRQFAYKRGGSCGVCAHQLLDTVRHYHSRGSTVSIIFLDSSKAFDKLVPGTLCSKLLDRGISGTEK